MNRSAWQLGVLTLLLQSPAGTLIAQSVTERTPNLDVGWTVAPGIIQFNFLHRFEVSAPPSRKVTSFPNFHLATGLPYQFNVGPGLRHKLYRVRRNPQRISAGSPPADSGPGTACALSI